MPTKNSDILLKVENLNAGYGKRQVLFDVSFEVNPGEIVLIIGSNGSGKSTVLKSIYGLLNDFEKRSGTVTFGGEDITNNRPFQMIGRGLVYVPQKYNSFERLTVLENLQLVANNTLPKDRVEEQIATVFKNLPELSSLKKRIPFQLSGGEKQQLALGMSLIPQPKMIMLDEPGAGLSATVLQKHLLTIQALNQKEITFLIVEHRVTEYAELTENIIQMKSGKIEF